MILCICKWKNWIWFKYWFALLQTQNERCTTFCSLNWNRMSCFVSSLFNIFVPWSESVTRKVKHRNCITYSHSDCRIACHWRETFTIKFLSQALGHRKRKKRNYICSAQFSDQWNSRSLFLWRVLIEKAVLLVVWFFFFLF